MSEEKNNIDQLFKDKLSNRSFDIPADYVTNLESMLPPEKSNGKLLWWIFGPLFIVALSLVYLWPSNTNLALYETSLSEKKIDSIKIEEALGSTDLAFVKNMLALVEDSHLAQTEVKNAIDKSNYINISSDSKAAIQKADKDILTNKDQNIANLASGKVTNSVKKDKYDFTAKAETNSNEINGSTIKSKSIQDSSFKKGNEYLITALKEDTTKKKKFPTVDSNSLSQDAISYRDSVVIRDSVVVRDSIVVRDSVVIRDSVILRENSTNWELGMYGGLSTVNARISNASILYSESLASSESTTFSPEFGINASRIFNKMQMGLGVNYYQYGERYNYKLTKTTSEDSVSMNVVIDSILYDSVGDPYDTIFATYYDTTQINYYSEENRQGQNSYSKISIPLSFGYRFTYKDWKFIPQISLNFEFEINNSLKRYPNQDKSDLVASPAKRIALSYVAQFAVRRDFDNWFLYVSPFYRSSISNVIQTPNMDRKYGALGTMMGLGIKF